MLRPPAAHLSVILHGTGTGALVSAIAIFVIIRGTEIRTHTGANTRQLYAHLVTAGIQFICLPIVERGISKTQFVLLALFGIVQILLVYGTIPIMTMIYDRRLGRVIFGLYGGERWKLLAITIHLAGATGGHLENIHMETTHFVPT